MKTARLVDGDDALATLHHNDALERLTTEWTPAAMRWRIDPRSGYEYAVAALAQSDAPNGIVYRTTSVHGGARVAVVIHSWGVPAERRVLFGAVARRHRCLAFLQPAGPGTAPSAGKPLLHRGESHLCVWNLGVHEARTGPGVPPRPRRVGTRRRRARRHDVTRHVRGRLRQP